jgi:membrane dipeptidase
MNSPRRAFVKISLESLALIPAIAFARASGICSDLVSGTVSTYESGRGQSFIDIQTTGGPDFEPTKALESGLTAIVVDIPAYPRTFENAVHGMAEWNYAIRKPDSQMYKVLTATDMEQARAQNKLGIILSCQDGQILDASTQSVYDYNLQNLQLFYDLGMRMLTLTHNERNALGDSFREESDAGLSYLGKSVIDSMNTLGMIVDLSHCGDRTSREAVAQSKKPCTVTHAGCRALYPSLRNKPDELIRLLAERGGLFGVYNMSNWLTADDDASVDTVMDHLEHAVNVGGIEHVAFGSDGPPLQIDDLDAELKGIQEYYRQNLGTPGAEEIPSHIRVRQLNTPQRMQVLAEAFQKRGYAADAVDKIMGGNFRRVFGEVCG